MFHRKDVVPLSFLCLVILTIMITLSQILVVHNKHHHVHKDSHDFQRFKVMLFQLELHINSMLKKDVLPLHKYRESFAAEIYAARVNSLLKQEEMRHGQGETEPEKGNSERAQTNIYWTKRRSSMYYRTNRIIRESNEIKRRNETISAINNYVTNNVTDSKSSRSLLLQRVAHDNGVIANTSVYSDFDGHVDGASAINEVTAHRGNQGNQGQDSTTGRHRNNHVITCPNYPTGLVGRIGVFTKIKVNVTHLISSAGVNLGGHWRPESCLPRFKVAIIIPYRDRQAHLITLLFYLIPILKRQQVEFRVFVVEQAGRLTFNKGAIMNAGYKEAVRISDYHCYIFHDVDLIPEDDRNLYTCPGIPRHLSVAVDKFRYTLPYAQLVGGVFAIRREDYELVNGYSNLYWGWGAEDDDMSIRLAVAGMKLSRPSATVARYKMLKHNTREHVPGKWISYLLKTVKKRFTKDGLSTVNYNVTYIHMEPLFTHIMIDVGNPPKIVGNISAITGR